MTDCETEPAIKILYPNGSFSDNIGSYRLI